MNYERIVYGQCCVEAHCGGRQREGPRELDHCENDRQQDYHKFYQQQQQGQLLCQEISAQPQQAWQQQQTWRQQEHGEHQASQHQVKQQEPQWPVPYHTGQNSQQVQHRADEKQQARRRRPQEQQVLEAARKSSGAWTEAENEALKSGLSLYGKDLPRLVMHVGTRSRAAIWRKLNRSDEVRNTGVQQQQKPTHCHRKRKARETSREESTCEVKQATAVRHCLVSARTRQAGADGRYLPRKNQREDETDSHGIPPIHALGEIFADEGKAVQYMIERGVLEFDGELGYCKHCGTKTPCSFKKRWGEDTTTLERSNMKLKCRTCRRVTSLFYGTVFENKRILKNKILLLMYLWVTKTSQKMMVTMMGIKKDTLRRLTKNLRQSCEAFFATEVGGKVQIGGPGVIVQIDESKYGKRKYNRGHRIKGNWVFGGIEYIRDEQTGKMRAGKFFATVVKKRSEKVLKPIIEAHILPGSIIHSDFWKAYINIEDYVLPPQEDDEEDGRDNVSYVPKKRYQGHGIVIHEHEFKSKEGVHTNTIEGYWRVSKEQIPKQHYCDEETLQEHLFVQMWRSRWRFSLWEGLLYTLSKVRYREDVSVFWYRNADGAVVQIPEAEFRQVEEKENTTNKSPEEEIATLIKLFAETAVPGQSLNFSAELSRWHRKVVHEQAQKYGLMHGSLGTEGYDRYVIVAMPQKTGGGWGNGISTGGVNI